MVKDTDKKKRKKKKVPKEAPSRIISLEKNPVKKGNPHRHSTQTQTPTDSNGVLADEKFILFR